MNLRKEKLERYKNAEISLADVLDVTPVQINSLLLTGYTFFTQGKMEDAKNILEGLALLNENISNVHALLGSIYQKNEDYEAAVEKYTRALLLEPADLYSLGNRGESLLRLGRFDEAADDLKKAVGLDLLMKHPAANRARLLVNLMQDAMKTFIQI